MSNAAIITLARSVSNSLSRLWWPLRAGRVGQVARLLWDLADRLQRSDEELRVVRNRVAELAVLRHETEQDRRGLLALSDVRALAIAKLTADLAAERERCARLILQRQRTLVSRANAR